MLDIDVLQLQEEMPWLFPLMVFLFLWEMVWKVIAMWKAARNNQLVWFVCILLINTIGILPIIYLILHRKKEGLKR